MKKIILAAVIAGLLSGCNNDSDNTQSPSVTVPPTELNPSTTPLTELNPSTTPLTELNPPTRIPPTELGPSTPIPELDFRQETIYFLFLDRFKDGDPNNNEGNDPATYDPKNFKKYMGGDIRGLIDKLDYLKEMGITAIWITPPVDNADFLDKHGGAGYHGYWGKDFFAVDEHLGTLEDFKELADKMALPEYDMKLVLDYAPNHSNGNDENEFGALLKAGVPVTTYPADVGADPKWYHHHGGIAENGANHEWHDDWAVRNKSLFNLADFDQDNPEVYQYLTDGAKFWIDAGVDAIRIDAIKHMDKEFIQKWTDEVTEYAKMKGNGGFYFFGEWFGASANTTGGLDGQAIDYANTSGSALLDFGYRDTLERVLTNRVGNNMHTLNEYLEKRNKVFKEADKQVVFMDNHDMARISTALRSDQHTFGPGNNEAGGSFKEETARGRLEVGLTATMTIPGVPAIYYGTEHYAARFDKNAFGQIGSDPYNREMMPSFETNTKAFNIIKALAELRKESPAIQSGSYTHRWKNEDILVYERQEGDDVVLVALNRGYPATIDVINLVLGNGEYQSLIGDEVVTVSGGTARFVLKANSAIVLHKPMS